MAGTHAKGNEHMSRDMQKLQSAHTFPAVTPSDTVALSKVNNEWPSGLSIAAAGTLRVTQLDGTVVNFASGELAAGVVHPISVKLVHSTGTTATNIRVYYNAGPRM